MENREIIKESGIHKLIKVDNQSKIEYEFYENDKWCITEKNMSFEDVLETWTIFENCEKIFE